ncbi:glutathione S-transferase [Gigaspora margarita]|uniref:glutathione transferase n=1 Tax=Gigaspora margarita TaxID=4874 RepID=A0A8H4AHZ9_GIGMA|nr:glutathione S-transferase [Gigaspora margarita]
MTIRLIGYSASGPTLRVIICLKELGLPYELEPPASYQSLKDEDYIANKHPFGKMPVLFDAGLIDQFISYELSYYDPPLSKLVYQEKFAQKFFNKDPDPEVIKQAREELAKVLDVYEKLLEGKEYLNGEYSLADLVLCPATNYGYGAGHSDLWDNRPNVKNWWNRLCNRDANKKSFEEIKSFWENN